MKLVFDFIIIFIIYRLQSLAVEKLITKDSRSKKKTKQTDVEFFLIRHSVTRLLITERSTLRLPSSRQRGRLLLLRSHSQTTITMTK